MLGTKKRKPKFGYSLYSGTGKPKTFWRWEVCNLSTKMICDAGVLYGTEADALTMASSAIGRLSSLEQLLRNGLKKDAALRQRC
jgi:hypothetical protein